MIGFGSRRVRAWVPLWAGLVGVACGAACGEDTQRAGGDGEVAADGDETTREETQISKLEVEVALEVEDEVALEVEDEVALEVEVDDEIEVVDETEDEVVLEVEVDDAAEVEAEVTCGPCDDGLECTDDACGSDGVCTHTPQAGWCAIDGACVAAGMPNGRCRVCDPSLSVTALSSRTKGACNDDNVCTIGETCELGVCGGGQPVLCNRPNACQISEGCIPEAGGCITTGLADGTPCGTDQICSTETCVAGDSLPTGTIAWFDRPSCPTGWGTYAFATGRTLVPADASGIAARGQIGGSALAPLQDPTHGHSVSAFVTPGSVSFAGIAGCCNNSPASANSLTISGNLAAASSGLPYVQLLACRKTATLAVGTVPSHIRFFVDAAACPAGTDPTTSGHGRLVVATPAGGAFGVPFGAAALGTAHHHRVQGTIGTPAAGIALASSGAGGYASSGGLAFDVDSSDSSVDFPWRTELECAVGESAGTTDEAAPSGLVVFVDGPSCPVGLLPYAKARGRLIVGVANGHATGETLGTPLSDREDRTHVHSATLGGTFPSKSIAAANGGNNAAAAAGNISGTFTTEVAGSGMPFFQLLACKKP